MKPTGGRELFRQEMIAFLRKMDHNGDFDDESAAAQSLPPMTIKHGTEIVQEWAWDEIGGDFNTGVLPPWVNCFADLHNYVDANKYGGAFEWPSFISDHDGDDEYQDAHCGFWNRVQSYCDAKLRANEHRKSLYPDECPWCGKRMPLTKVSELKMMAGETYCSDECVRWAEIGTIKGGLLCIATRRHPDCGTIGNVALEYILRHDWLEQDRLAEVLGVAMARDDEVRRGSVKVE